MKIGILSMQRINNMGSLLQAYGLMKIIEKLGHEVEFIDIKRNQQDYQLLQKELDYSNEYSKRNTVRKIVDHPINRVIIRSKMKKQNFIYNSFRNDVLHVNNTSKQYDVCVIGSDEVFNCLNAGEWGFTSQLFGNVENANKVITYAASCGATKYELLSQQIVKRIKESFDCIYSFSVRDQNTYHFVSSIIDKEINYNLDPVLVYDFEKEISAAELPIPECQYCIVYSYRNRINGIDEINGIKKFCKEKNLVLLAAGAPQPWIKTYVPCSPFQCLKLFKNAEFIITDTFHGTIFSSKYSKRFGIMIRESNKNKLLDLVKRLEISKHVMGNITDLKAVYAIESDKKSIKKIIDCEYEKTVTYLKSAL